MKRALSILAALGGIVGGLEGAPAATPIVVNGVDVAWRLDGPTLQFTVSAPTAGWVALGLNSEDDIVGTELFMMRFTENGPEASHRYVSAVGDHRPVEQFGRDTIISELAGRRGRGSTEFTITLRVDCPYYQGPPLTSGAQPWLIVAYSASPDYDHHSRMREHVRIRL